MRTEERCLKLSIINILYIHPKQTLMLLNTQYFFLNFIISMHNLSLYKIHSYSIVMLKSARSSYYVLNVTNWILKKFCKFYSIVNIQPFVYLNCIIFDFFIVIIK